LKAHGFVGSMSRKGNFWDNAVAESFFGSLKQERVQWRNYQTRNEAQQDIMNYITMWYNSLRLHSYLETFARLRRISLNVFTYIFCQKLQKSHTLYLINAL